MPIEAILPKSPTPEPPLGPCAACAALLACGNEDENEKDGGWGKSEKHTSARNTALRAAV